VRGGNPLNRMLRHPSSANKRLRSPGSVFPTLQAVQGLKTSRELHESPHAEGDARNAHRQEVSAIECESPARGM
jgi:hypothetical protein